MGTLGPGNFDNDDAAIFLLDLCDRLIANIEAIFEDEQRFALDEDGEGQLVPSVDIIALLSERYDLRYIKQERAIAWKKRYLAMFDDQINDITTSASHRERRRAIIAATFDRLIQVSRVKDDER